MLKLRPYQHSALDASAADLDEHPGVPRKQLTALPTGTGKTVVFSEKTRRRGGTALILAHRDELLSQAEEKLRTVAPELAMSIGRVHAGRNDVLSQIVVASVQTLASRKRLAELPRYFDTIVVDEAHHATAPSYGRVFEHVAGSPLISGFTATAYRADGKTDLRNVFDTLVYARSLPEMIDEGYLCDLRALRVEVAGLDLSQVKKSRGDYQADALGAALEDADAIDHAVAAYLEHAYGTQCVAFFPTVATSRHAAAAFADAGVKAAHIDGTTPRNERRDILKWLKAGVIQVVCNVNVLTEGFDEPSLTCIIIALPTKSRIRYAQMVGRGTRIYPGKTECLILDVVGVTDDLSLQSVGVLFGLQKPPRPTETATQAVAREKAEAEAKASRAARGPRRHRRPAKTKTVKLFNRELIPWVQIGERWAVQLGAIHLVLDPVADGMWRVALMGPDRASPTGSTFRIVARNLDIGYAMGAVETIIRDAGLESLADREAPWRSQPATRQHAADLRRLGLPVAQDLTKGDAVDRIALATATERLARVDAAIARQRRTQS